MIVKGRMKLTDIIYTLEGGVYFNITNKCPCYKWLAPWPTDGFC